MASLGDRMIRAAKLDRGLYEEVEADTGATGQAMLVVVLSSVAAGIGSAGVGGLERAILWGAIRVGSLVHLGVSHLLHRDKAPARIADRSGCGAVAPDYWILELAWIVANIGHPTGTHGNRVSGMCRLDAGRHGHCRPAGARLSRHRKSNRSLPNRLGGPSGDHWLGHDVSGHWSGARRISLNTRVAWASSSTPTRVRRS